MLRRQYQYMDNSSGVGVLDKAALVLAALEAGPAHPRRARAGDRAGPARRRTGSPSHSNTTVWSRATCRAGSSSARGWPSWPRPPARTGCSPPPARCSSPARHHRRERAALPPPGRRSASASRRPSGCPGCATPSRSARCCSMQAGSAAQVLLAWEEPERMHRGLQGARFTATALAGSTPARLGAERRRARAGGRQRVRPGARRRRQGDRRGVGVGPDRAAQPRARAACTRRRSSTAAARLTESLRRSGGA